MYLKFQILVGFVLIFVLSGCTKEDEYEPSGCVEFILLNPALTGVEELNVVFDLSLDASNSTSFTLSSSGQGTKKFCDLPVGIHVYLLTENDTVKMEGEVNVQSGQTHIVSVP